MSWGVRAFQDIMGLSSIIFFQTAEWMQSQNWICSLQGQIDTWGSLSHSSGSFLWVGSMLYPGGGGLPVPWRLSLVCKCVFCDRYSNLCQVTSTWMPGSTWLIPAGPIMYQTGPLTCRVTGAWTLGGVPVLASFAKLGPPWFGPVLECPVKLGFWRPGKTLKLLLLVISHWSWLVSVV